MVVISRAWGEGRGLAGLLRSSGPTLTIFPDTGTDIPLSLDNWSGDQPVTVNTSHDHSGHKTSGQFSFGRGDGG